MGLTKVVAVSESDKRPSETYMRSWRAAELGSDSEAVCERNYDPFKVLRMYLEQLGIAFFLRNAFW